MTRKKVDSKEIELKMEDITNIIENSIVEQDGILYVNSKKLAEVIDKKHQHLMRDIRGYIESLNTIPKMDSTTFFVESTYVNQLDKTQPCYLCTKQGVDMICNKMTGTKGVLYSAYYIKAFYEMEQKIEELKEDKEKLYEIAISPKEQANRQYEADKTKYALRNVKDLLENAEYTELESIVNKIIEVHTNLKKKDRYIYHQNLSATDYKQLVRNTILEKIRAIVVEGKGKGLLYNTVALTINDRLQEERKKTVNRSVGQVISHKDKKISELQERYELKYPEKVVTINVHPFSNNYMYRDTPYGKKRTEAYDRWIANFPREEAMTKEYWEELGVDFTKPIEITYCYIVKKKYEDGSNFDKAFFDMLFNRIYKVDDKIVKKWRGESLNIANSYEEGEIQFYLRNVIDK